jgi:hypothetical protein
METTLFKATRIISLFLHLIILSYFLPPFDAAAQNTEEEEVAADPKYLPTHSNLVYLSRVCILFEFFDCQLSYDPRFVTIDLVFFYCIHKYARLSL